MNTNRTYVIYSCVASYLLAFVRFICFCFCFCFLSTSDDWVIETNVGTKLWCNHKTGEVSDICPWEDLNEGLMPFAENDVDDENVIDLLNPHENTKGTGALVYDGTALEEMFSMLDGAKDDNKNGGSLSLES